LRYLELVMGPSKKCRWTGIRVFGLLLVALAVLGAGCVHSRRSYGRLESPTPPAFLNGPIAVLLTNVDGFGAHVAMEIRKSSNRTELVAGELLGRGTRLFFVPESAASSARSAREGASFIWDVNENSGYALNEALQGYAPIASNVRFTNVSARLSPAPPALETIDGYQCEESESVVVSSEGQATELRVWRATELNRFPIRINLATNPAPMTISFSQIHLQKPANELFLPPDGFTKYPSVETMITEMAGRQQSLRRGPPVAMPETDRPGPRDGGRYRGGY